MKLRTANSSRVSAFSSTKRIDWSSSTIQIGFIRAAARHGIRGMTILKIVRPGSLSNSTVPWCCWMNVLCERETEAGAPFAAGHEREEDLLAQCLRNARPVVLDMQFQCQTIAVLAERHLADDARAQRDLRAAGRDLLGERLGGVAGDVEDGLDELLAVAAELGDRGVVVAQRRQAARELGQDQRAHPLAHLVDVDVADDVRLAVRREQAVDEQLQPVGLLDDHLGVFGQRARLDLHLEQLRRAADAAERVLDLVGEVADQLLGRLGLLERALLALLAVLLLDLDDLEDDVASSRRSG